MILWFVLAVRAAISKFAPLARLFGLAIFGGGSGKIGLAFVQVVDLLLVVGLDFTPSGDFVDLALDGKFLGLDVVVELLGGPLRNRVRTIDAAAADRVAAFGKQHEDQTDGHHRPPGQKREAAEIRSQVGGDFPAFRSARRGRRLRPAAVGNDERLVARRALDPLPQMGVADLESMAFRTGRFVGHAKTPQVKRRWSARGHSVYFNPGRAATWSSVGRNSFRLPEGDRTTA